MDFVGIDLAWSPRHTTGVVVARGHGAGARVEAASAELRGHGEVTAFVEDALGTGPGLLAIDAPLVVPNLDSVRPCDRRVNALFRRYHAGVLPANRSTLGRYDGFEGERLRERLLERGYRDAVPLPDRAFGRAFFETYPHAAAVVLFGLEERLPYKARGGRRPWPVRHRAYRRFQACLRGLADADPPLRIPEALLSRDVEAMEAAARKRYEDLLDATLCAYVALYAWHRSAACEVLGSLEEGYMVLPMDPQVRTSVGTA